MKAIDRDWIEQRLLERFLRYVRIDTTSDRHSKSSPTTAGQLELARVLVEELGRLSVEDVELDGGGFLFAHLESNLKGSAKQPPAIGFIAHLDTSDAAPGRDVDPMVHEEYDGKIIALKEGGVLDPEEFPELRSYSGQKIVTSDGRTLLGADDKAGLAEIMTAVEYLVNHPELPHGKIGIYFTPDEEQGLSMQRFPIEKISAKYCYTFDGGEEGTIEAECFEGYKADLRFIGKSIHTGVARGKLVNAIEMAGKFLSLLPGAESPQATDGRYGFYFPLEITGGIEETTLEIYRRAGGSQTSRSPREHGPGCGSGFPSRQGGDKNREAVCEYASLSPGCSGGAAFSGTGDSGNRDRAGIQDYSGRNRWSSVERIGSAHTQYFHRRTQLSQPSRMGCRSGHDPSGEYGCKSLPPLGGRRATWLRTLRIGTDDSRNVSENPDHGQLRFYRELGHEHPGEAGVSGAGTLPQRAYTDPFGADP